MRLHVELFHDDEVDQWGYSVPTLSIVGTGCNSRTEAERLAVEAVQELLGSDDQRPDDRHRGDPDDVLTFDVRIARAG